MRKKKRRKISGMNLLLAGSILGIILSLFFITSIMIKMQKELLKTQEKREATVSTEEATTESLEDIIKREIPILYQNDERWASKIYGSGPLEETGCGPTCLSMVAMFQLQDPSMTPDWMADYSTENGYCVPGSGTAWIFMSEGARSLGLNPMEINPSKDRVLAYLNMGKPIICVTGPGQFTDKGHFIVLAGVVGDRIKIYDPNSKIHSERLWEYEEFIDEVRNLWVYY